MSGGLLAVLDIGRRSAEATVIAVSAPRNAPSARLPPETAILACRHEPIGGDDLDEVVIELLGASLPERCRPRWQELRDGLDPAAAPQRRSLRQVARQVRESLSTAREAVVRLDDPVTEIALTQAQLRPVLAPMLARAVDLLATTVADTAAEDDPWPPVLLIGGVAHTPLLAELVAERAGAAATVTAEPGNAAVRGAQLAAPPLPLSPPPAARLLPPPPRPRRHLVRNGVLVVTGAGLLALAGQLIGPGGPAAPATGPAEPPPAGLLVQYDYALRLPAGWRHSGGLPEHRRSLLTPADRPGGSDLISVEQTLLDYDTGAEPRRAAAELRRRYDDALAAGSALEAFEPVASFAGRQVTSYRQRQPERDAVVDWYVIFDGTSQLSVGCQHTAAGAAAVRAGCAAVASSLRLRPR